MNSQSEVLAIKYRPKRFEDLIGQNTISQTLSLALESNRLSHAYLLSGLRGSGKTSTARIFSKALLCDIGPTSKPCDECEHCRMANEGRHIDIVEMDAASSRKIDDIRDLIEQTKYKPASARFKIFIIDEVHMLTKEAFNALLKTLEEPPSYIKFILATTDPLKLPATILSRTQHFRFKRIAHHNIVHHLSHILNLEKIEYESEALDILARSGSGSLRDTLTLLDQAIIYSKNLIDAKSVAQMLGLVDPLFIDNLFDAILNKRSAEVIEYVKKLEDYEAEMVVDELIAYLKERLYAADGRFSPMLMERFFNILSHSKSLFAINADDSFTLSLIFFKMMEALKIKAIDDAIAQLEAKSGNLEVMPSKKPDNTTLKPEIKRDEHTQESSQVDEAEEAEEPILEPPMWEESPSSVAQDFTPLFEELKRKLYDRNVELGECFDKYIDYISYIEQTLTWESCANKECRERLRHGWGVVRHFVQEVFGIDTKIVNSVCSKEDNNSEEEKISNSEPTKQTQLANTQNQSTSMVEDAAIDSGSIVESEKSEQQKDSEAIDAEQMLKEPMVERAKELFQAEKIVVQTKV